MASKTEEKGSINPHREKNVQESEPLTDGLYSNCNHFDDCADHCLCSRQSEPSTTAVRYGPLTAPQASPRKYEIVYASVATFAYWHLAALYGLYLCFTSAKWETIALVYAFYTMGEIGIMVGAHRLWSHRSFKAKMPLEILIMLFNSIAFQNTATDWVRNHRMHHMYCDTDADPHNAARGFFFSHMGWLLVRKHPELRKRSHTINMSDIYNNPVLRFQKKYAIPLIGTLCFGLPVIIPIYCWGETLNNAWHLSMLRFVLNLNASFLVNSAAHMFGTRPYDKNILPTQNLLATVVTLGEGFHNQHHVFPWDYRSAELGNNLLNFNTLLIDFFAWVGWAYDLKTVSNEAVRRRVIRTGDGTDL